MPVAGIIGGLIGVIAALGGVFVALFATGMFEYQGGRKSRAWNPLVKTSFGNRY